MAGTGARHRLCRHGRPVGAAALLEQPLQLVLHFSQDHYAGVWLGNARTEADAHDAVADAILSMRLFGAYTSVQHDPAAVAAMAAKVIAVKPKPSFAVLNPTFEGCCMGNRKTCKCGAPFFS